MLRKSTLVIAVLLGLMVAIGYAEAAERGVSTRNSSIRSVSTNATQVQSTGSLSLSKILRARFLQTWKMLADLEDAQSEPPVFGTNGLSDGPDPIDGSGQVGGGAGPPDEEGRGDSPGGGGDGAAGNEGSSFDSMN